MASKGSKPGPRGARALPGVTLRRWDPVRWDPVRWKGDMSGLQWRRLRYSLYSPFYDVLVGFDRVRRRSVELASPRPGERILIPGAGPGRDLEFLPGGVEVVTGDLAGGMIRQLRRRGGRVEERTGSTIQVMEMDAQATGLADASFDVVLLHLVAAVVADGRACLAESTRVLRPGGRLLVFDKFAPEDRPLSLLRRVANPVSRLLFTSLDRRLGDLVEGLPLTLECREAAALGGFFELALFRRRG
ncbi:MAG: methyltransferase domain-containing protein [Gemmatimonadales bacterium]|nr:MAG: methyltransferase domain-containing protein [Gemmatimonadales bacterium]